MLHVPAAGAARWCVLRMTLTAHNAGQGYQVAGLQAHSSTTHLLASLPPEESCGTALIGHWGVPCAQTLLQPHTAISLSTTHASVR